jgi:predicted heme/steroid binding protein
MNLRFSGIFGILLLIIGISVTVNAQEPTTPEQSRLFTLEELAGYTGQDGKPAYIAVDGVVYDMTKVPEWMGGMHIGYAAGHDVTEILNTIAPHGRELLEGIPIVGRLAGTEDTPPAAISPFQRLRPRLVSILGIVNAILAIIGGALFSLRRINRYGFSNKNATIKRLLKPLSKAHPYIGTTLVITALIHGMLALGTLLKLHTGPVAWVVLVLMMGLATIGKRYKFRYWLKLHRGLAIVFVIMIILHILMAQNIF